MIPQTDPRANYLAHRSEIDAAIAVVLDRGRFVLGEEVAAFEREFADYLQGSGMRGVEAVGVASGTDALRLALRACGVGTGDTVITVSHTAVATVSAIQQCDAKPILIDIEPSTMTMDPVELEAAIVRCKAAGARPSAVVPVHLYGHPAAIKEIAAVAAHYGLRVIEDCAQAHGASVDGRHVGTFGDAAAFSFYPTKNLGAFGDGGALVTNNHDIAERVRSLREYGWRDRFVSVEPGVNSRLDEIQAAVLRVKLPHLDAENTARRRFAGIYSEKLAHTDAALPIEVAGTCHVFHQYVIRVTHRNAARAILSKRGINTLIHYPVPIHLQPAYTGDIRMQDPLRHTEKAANEVLSLPMFPELGDERAEEVAESVARALTGDSMP
ncbi:MAG: DegT/DnrJ/EryC1/StrS family aminotransferase [Thermoleophilia bacterium]|nr:DegT/DnrJ/EryC1/StrS family aminotransferase [Thermoleophilia bacterium]